MTAPTDLNSVPGIAERLFLDGPEFQVAEDPSVRRQSALTMLAKFAQETTNSRQLFVEAAVLASRTLESDFFVTAHLQSGSSTGVALSGTQPTVNSEVEVIETTFDRNDDQCLLSQALKALEPLIIEDLPEKGRSNDLLLTTLNACSALICPIQYAGHEYGVIGVLSLQPKRATMEDVLFLQTLSLLLGPTVAYQRTEAVLAQHSALYNATIESLDSMVLVLSSEGKIIRLNRACEELTGFKSEDLKDRHFWGAYLLPEEVSIATDAF